MLSENTKDRFGGIARLYDQRALERFAAARVANAMPPGSA